MFHGLTPLYPEESIGPYPLDITQVKYLSLKPIKSVLYTHHVPFGLPSIFQSGILVLLSPKQYNSIQNSITASKTASTVTQDTKIKSVNASQGHQIER
jgi:hypothetical protein